MATLEQLAKMTPEERHQDFLDCQTAREDLSPRHQRMLREQEERVMRREREREQQQAS